MHENQEWGEMATPMDACREYALNVGRDREESAWILTDFDVWMPNPFYSGPPVPHPEDDMRGWKEDYDDQLFLNEEEEEERNQVWRELAQMSADEEAAAAEFNQAFPLGGPDLSPAPDRELPKDELPF